MRLNSLHLCNFRQHVDTRIEFDAGITGIIGPNGSGKTTILEAIAWALYGTPAARGTRESIRSYRANARAPVKVELDFELNGHRYLVSRGLTSAELYLDGATAPIATSISVVTDLLRRRLGMSHDEFFNTYFTGQRELNVMSAMGPADRAQFLSRVLGYERLRTAQKLVRERRNAIVSESVGLRAGMPDADTVTRMLADAEARLADALTKARAAADRRALARRTLDELTPRWESLQRERDALQALVAELRVAESEAGSALRDVERLDRELADAAQARTELDGIAGQLAPLDALRAELSELDRALGEEGRRRTLADGERILAEELTRLRDRRARIETAPALEAEIAGELAHARAELEQAQTELDAARTAWVRDRQEAETKREALLAHLRDVGQQRQQIVELGEDGTCPTCARPLGDHFRSVLDLFDSQIEEITANGKYFRSRMEQLGEVPADVKALDERRRQGHESVTKLEARTTKVQLAVQELAGLTRDVAAKEQRHAQVGAELAAIRIVYDTERHDLVRVEVARMTPLAARATLLGARLEREPQLVAQRARAGESIAGARARIGDLTTRRDQLRFSEASFGEMRAAYEHAAGELRASELAAVDADADARSAKSALEGATNARAELTRIEAPLATLLRDRRLHDELDRAFTDLRTDLNQELRPEISYLASKYIRELTDGRYSELELDDQYNVMVLEDAIPKPVISGGEEDIANLAVRLAISEMIADRAGQSFSLLILDEIFGSLDEARRNNVVDLLRRLNERFEQVIIITHVESVCDGDGVDRRITVRYDDETGTSRVSIESASAPLELDVQAGAAD